MGQVVWWVSHSSMQAWWNSCLQAGSLRSISSLSYSPRHTLQVSPLHAHSCLISHPLPLPPFCCTKKFLVLPARCLKPFKDLAAYVDSSVTSSVVPCSEVRWDNCAHPWALPVSTSGAAGTLYGYTGKLLMTASSIPSRCGSAGAMCRACTALILNNRIFRHSSVSGSVISITGIYNPPSLKSAPVHICSMALLLSRLQRRHFLAASHQMRGLHEDPYSESRHGWLTGCGLCRCAYLRQSPAARQNTTESVTPNTMLRYGLSFSVAKLGGAICLSTSKVSVLHVCRMPAGQPLKPAMMSAYNA